MANGSSERRQRGVEDGWICVGALAGAHGVRGDVRVKSFTEDPEAIFAFASLHKGANGPVIKLKRLREDKEGFIARLDSVKNREDAQALKGTGLYVARDVFAAEDEDEFYLADLIGLDALDKSGTRVGFVRAVENFGAEDLVELVLDKPLPGLGRFAFIPFRKAFVPVVDIAGGTLTIAFDDWVSIHVSERDEDDTAGEAVK
ncbi:ribosome maturation factor RimM [Kordiimonas aestuarii]|uniref:ribosome maturation factor RimM n=1 Tax=Kordiimonas aestuarii TaxID=1005925 RepID=UPI0021D3E255|nr:ribosome maturation factor RimM [Kordiimonas aestuarii]